MCVYTSKVINTLKVKEVREARLKEKKGGKKAGKRKEKVQN